VGGNPKKQGGEISPPCLSASEKGGKMKVRRILIVDDNFPSRLAMEKVIQSRSYETFSCGSGEHAVMKLREEFFDILITDFQMRGMDGLELIKEARGIHPGISTILVTGHAGDEIKLRAKEEGVNEFLPKPIEWDELISSLNVLTRMGRDGKQDIQRNDGEYRHSG
jgi:CheY-like chemotaxis protein